MPQSNETWYLQGLSCKNFTPPPGCIADAAVAPAADVNDTKLRHRYQPVVSQTGTVVADTRYLRIAQAAGTVLAVEAAITETIATGADRQVVVDLQKSTGGAAFATVLTAPITFTNASALRTVVTAAISTPGLLDNDILRLVITVAGVAGAQALGLIANVVIAEQAQ